MATNNFYNHENGIYIIEIVTFEQMKEWMETDEAFEWSRDENGNVHDEEVWEQLGYHNQDIVDEWLGDFADMVKYSNTGLEIIADDRYNASAYNKGGKLIAKLELVSGYYDGYQVIVETDPNMLLDGYFSNTTELLEQYTPNHKMLLKCLGKCTKQLELLGQFSNGEAIYSYLK